MLSQNPTVFIFFFSSYLLFSTFLVASKFGFYNNGFIHEFFCTGKKTVIIEKGPSKLEKLIAGVTRVTRRRYLNLVPKVLDSRKSCRNTKHQVFVLKSFSK